MDDVIQKVESGVFPSERFLDPVFQHVDIGKAHGRMDKNQSVGKVVVTVE